MGENRAERRGKFKVCAYDECGGVFRDEHVVGRPRRYCQVACRRRAQRKRDRQAKRRVDVAVRDTRARGGDSRNQGRKLLARALQRLLWFSGLTLSEVAEMSRLPSGCVEAMVSGRSVRTWPTTFVLVATMRGAPEDVRWLWEWASGRDEQASASPSVSVQRVFAAVRGLRLASGRLAGDDRKGGADSSESACLLSDWQVACELIEQLGGSSVRFRPLWEQARRAVMEAPGFLTSEAGDGGA